MSVHSWQSAGHVQLARLVAGIAWRIDRGKADTVHELFVDDGEMALGQTSLRAGLALLAAPPKGARWS
jgi:hypothetical protein